MTGYWRVPKLWPNAEVFIVGGGPGFDPEWVPRLEGRRVIAVNEAAKLAPWDVLYYGDCGWGRTNRDFMRDFAGLKVTRCVNHLNARGFPDVKVVAHKNAPHMGLSSDPNQMIWNKCSGNAAVNLATLLGARRIVLLGFDMRVVKVCDDCGRDLEGDRCEHKAPERDASNWHRNYPETRSQKQKEIDYKGFRTPWPFIARDLERAGVEIINATPRSAIDCVPIVDPEEVLPSGRVVKC